MNASKKTERGFLALGVAGASHLSLATLIAVWGGRHLPAGTTWRAWEITILSVLLGVALVGYVTGIVLALSHRECRRLLFAGVFATVAVAGTVIANIWTVALRESAGWAYHLADNAFFFAVPVVLVLAIQWAASRATNERAA